MIFDGWGEREIKTTSPIWRGNLFLSCIKTIWTNSIELNFGTRMSLKNIVWQKEPVENTW
jgi:hypothetical protein